MVPQTLDMLDQAVGIELFDGVHDSRVERSPPFGEQAAVGDFVGVRVLESVLQVRKQPGLVEEFVVLKIGEAPA